MTKTCLFCLWIIYCCIVQDIHSILSWNRQKGSLRNFFYDEEDILEQRPFLQLHGTEEAQILAADGTVKMYGFVKKGCDR